MNDAAHGSAEIGPLEKRALSILFVTVFIDLVGFGIVIPLLPLYAESMGASPVAVTALVAVYSLMQFVFAPWWGQLSDRVGRRPVLLVGLFGSGISYLFFGLATSLVGLFAARALAGVMGANIGVAQAYVADVTRSEDRARGMGVIGAAFGLGFIFGPVIGGLLSEFGAGVPFFAAAALATGNGLLALRWLPESIRSRSQPGVRQPRLKDRLELFRALSSKRAMAALYAVFFLITLAFAALEATLSLWADRRWRLSPAEVAYMFGYLGVIATIVQGVLIGPLAQRLGERRLALVGSAAFAFGLAVTPLAPSPVILAISLASIAFGQGVTNPSVAAMISHTAPETEQGSLLGVSQSISALARVLGPIGGGFVFAGVGIGAPYLAGALLSGIAFIVLAVNSRHLSGGLRTFVE